MDADRKARLGTRWSCECGTAFYDLGKAEAVCPRCDTKQAVQVPAKKKRPTKKAAGNYRRPLRQPTAEPKLPAEDDAFTELLDDGDAPVDEEAD